VSEAKLHSRTVLCIGSQTIGLNLRCGFLKEHGWRVLSSTNGYDAIVLFVAELVDVVVLDVDGNGAEAALIAGELKRTKANVHVIMLVAEKQTLVEGALDVADAVVTRSVRYEELLKAVNSIAEG
jgi:DNA-binding response OmpR family regulator